MRKNFQPPKKQTAPILKGRSVEVRNDDVNYALRKFKKMIQEDGILQTLKEKEFYTKPSVKRAREKSAGRARYLKKLEKNTLHTKRLY